MSDVELRQGAAWAFCAAEDVEHVAMSASASWTLVADRGRDVYVLDGDGEAQGQFRAGRPVRKLCADAAGLRFVALAGEDVVYAFNRQGELEWRVELGGPVADFDLSASGELVVAVSTQGWIAFHAPATRQQRLVPLGRRISRVTLAGLEPWSALVADEDGYLALVDDEGGVGWERQLSGAAGACVSPAAGRVVVPAREAVLRFLDLRGEEQGAVELPAPVCRLAVSADGKRFLAETVEGELVLCDASSRVLWQRPLDAAGAPWALGGGGRLIALCVGGREVRAYAVGGPPPAVEEPEPSEPGEGEAGEGPSGSSEVGVDAIEWPAHLEVDGRTARPPASRAPRVVRTLRTAWKKVLTGSDLPADRSQFRVGADGSLTIAVLKDGTALAFNASGQRVCEERLDPPVCLAPPMPAKLAVAWGPREARVLDPSRAESRILRWSDTHVVRLACSRDAGLLCTLDEDGCLSAFRGGDEPAWRKKLPGEPVELFVSPAGEMMMVSDRDDRFRYYDGEGRLVRKFRFADAEQRRPLALGDGFSVFAGSGGRLTMLDAFWQESWSARPFDRITRLELLGSALAVYGSGGECACVDPENGKVWDFAPPPGEVCVRWPTGGDPVVVHAGGRVLTAFTGYRRKLEVAWRYDCAAQVAALDTDLEARTVAAVAGDDILSMAAPGVG